MDSNRYLCDMAESLDRRYPETVIPQQAGDTVDTGRPDARFTVRGQDVQGLIQVVKRTA